MNLWRLLLLLLPVHFLVYLPANAETTQPTLRIAIPEDYPPYYYRDKDGQFRGASFEIAQLICKRLGYHINVSQLDNMRTVLAEMDAGRQDLNINLTATPERLEVALFTKTPHIHEAQNLIVRADTDINFDGKLVPLARYRFGPIFGWTYGPQFDQAAFLDKSYVNNSSEQLRGLLSGQFDIAVNNREFFIYTAREMGVTRAFRVLDPPVYNLPVTIAVSRQYPGAEKLVSKLEREVSQLIKEDAYQEILARYGFISPKSEKKS
ncbi:transporter substrate-binding domain-containing protein [Porticoccaceae bacterium LTM1]|nr:transporter substrate-binding domain-containing protein [Porticoccaceae bacterium LTM1]